MSWVWFVSCQLKSSWLHDDEITGEIRRTYICMNWGKRKKEFPPLSIQFSIYFISFQEELGEKRNPQFFTHHFKGQVTTSSKESLILSLFWRTRSVMYGKKLCRTRLFCRTALKVLHLTDDDEFWFILKLETKKPDRHFFPNFWMAPKGWENFKYTFCNGSMNLPCLRT